MQLPGIITLTETDTETINRVANMMGESFMEENWYITWLSALGESVSRERRLELMQASFHDEVMSFVPVQGYYALEDMTAATGVYLYSELNGRNPIEVEETVFERFASTATPEEIQILEEQEERMEPISKFHWARDVDPNDDFIHFFAWAVDPLARGKHSLTRLVTPFFAYADEHHLNCYLECYSDRLQSMYEHLGFEVFDEIKDDNFSVFERRMIRRPR